MTMTRTELQTVADSLQDGDEVKAVYHNGGCGETVIGEIAKRLNLIYFPSTGVVILSHLGLLSTLTHLEKIPKPIPDEPPVGFGVFEGGYFAQHQKEDWLYAVSDSASFSWLEIYPLVTRVYDLDGDVVEWDYSTREWRKK